MTYPFRWRILFWGLTGVWICTTLSNAIAYCSQYFFHNITHQTYGIMYFISLICGCVIGVVAAFVYEHRSIQKPKKAIIIEILAVIILNVLTTGIYVLTCKLSEMFQIHITGLP